MLLTRKIKIYNSNFKVRFFSKHYHIVSIQGAIGYISYIGNVIKIPNNGCVLVPKNSLVNCAIVPINGCEFYINIYKIHRVRRDIFLKINFENISALAEVENSNLLSKSVLIDALHEKIYHSLSNENRISDRSYSGKVFSVIRKDLCRRWELEDICCILYLSKTTLCRRLKEENTSLSQLLTTARMAKAAHLLKHSYLPIYRINLKMLA